MRNLNLYLRITCVCVLFFGRNHQAFKITGCGSNMISEVKDSYDIITNTATIEFKENKISVTPSQPLKGANINLYCESDTDYTECKLTHKPEDGSTENTKCQKSVPPKCNDNDCDDNNIQYNRGAGNNCSFTLTDVSEQGKSYDYFIQEQKISIIIRILEETY